MTRTHGAGPHGPASTAPSPEPGPPGPQPGPAVGPWGDDGMATAEYAIATLAACGFAALLVTILRSDQVRAMLLSIVERALSLG